MGAPRPSGGPRRCPPSPRAAETRRCPEPERAPRGRGGPASLGAQGCCPRPHFSGGASMGAGAAPPPRSPELPEGSPPPAPEGSWSLGHRLAGAGRGGSRTRAFPAGGGGTAVRVRAPLELPVALRSEASGTPALPPLHGALLGLGLPRSSCSGPRLGARGGDAGRLREAAVRCV